MSNALRTVGRTVEDWPDNKAKAAALVAAGNMGFGSIAEEVGITREGLWQWRREDGFAAEVKRLREAIHAEVYDRALAEREGRLNALFAAADALWAQYQANQQPAVIREWREVLKSIAIERGQWNPRADLRLTIENQPIQIVRVVYGTLEDRISIEERRIEQEVAAGTYQPVGSGGVVEGSFRELPRATQYATQPQGDRTREPQTNDDEWTQDEG